MSTTPPRYSAPDRSRQRVRLIAAIGLLASTAITIGGVVHLLSADADAEPTQAARAKLQAEASPAVEASPERVSRDSLTPLLTKIEQAERSVSSARAALHRARILGGFDVEQLDWLERRLDALGNPSTGERRPSIPAHEQAVPQGSSGEGPREL